jgi:hypothetical protein
MPSSFITVLSTSGYGWGGGGGFKCVCGRVFVHGFVVVGMIGRFQL